MPPPATPGLAADASCAVWGGSGWLSTRLTGAVWPGWSDPVTSGLLLLENGLSLKRDDSPLQPAIPIVVSANAAARGDWERNHWTIHAIAKHTLIRDTGR